MSPRKHASSCEGCQTPQKARYRVLLDRFLCAACYGKTMAAGVSAVFRGRPAPSAIQLSTLHDPTTWAVAPAATDAAEAEFDLRHLR